MNLPIEWPWTRRIFCTVLSYLSLMFNLGLAGIETKNKSCQFLFKIFATYFWGWKCGNFWIWFLLISKEWRISNSSITERVDYINNKTVNKQNWRLLHWIVLKPFNSNNLANRSAAKSFSLQRETIRSIVDSLLILVKCDIC